jgi:outer membrane protein TolC
VLGLSFRLPIGNSDARASNAQAQIDLKQGDERLRSLKQQIELDVRQAYENIETSKARADAAEVTVRYGQRRLQGEQDKYAIGATTTRFVIEAQRDLQDAQSRRARARIDLIKHRVNLDKALGETLEAHNIEVRKALGELR